MNEKEIVDLWKKGLSKNKLSEIYKRKYNQRIRIIRSSLVHRHSGRFISNYEALRKIEEVIYNYLKGDTNDR